MAQQTRDERAVFLGALELTTSAERAAFLQGACAGDADLLSRVKDLLDAHDESHGPLDSPPSEISPTIDSPNREQYLQGINQDLGLDLKTDWGVKGSRHNNHNVRHQDVDAPDCVLELCDEIKPFLDRFYDA